MTSTNLIDTNISKMTTIFLELAQSELESKGLKQITIDGYIRDLTKLRTNVKSTSKTFKYFNRTEKILTYINSVTNLNTKDNLFKPIMNILRDRPKQLSTYNIYLVESRKLRKEIQGKLKENKFTKKELDNKIEWKDIVDLKLINMNEKLYKSFIINDNLFLRLAYFSIKHKNFDKDDNYVDKGILYMNQFKNVDSLGRQKFKLSKKTLELIKLNSADDYIFTNHKISISGLSKFVSRIFKKKLNKSVNNNLLRKIYVNHILKTLPNITNKQIEEKARKMLNTFGVWISTYRKVDIKKEKKKKKISVNEDLYVFVVDFTGEEPGIEFSVKDLQESYNDATEFNINIDVIKKTIDKLVVDKILLLLSNGEYGFIKNQKKKELTDDEMAALRRLNKKRTNKHKGRKVGAKDKQKRKSKKVFTDKENKSLILSFNRYGSANLSAVDMERLSRLHKHNGKKRELRFIKNNIKEIEDVIKVTKNKRNLTQFTNILNKLKDELKQF